MAQDRDSAVDRLKMSSLEPITCHAEDRISWCGWAGPSGLIQRLSRLLSDPHCGSLALDCCQYELSGRPIEWG